MIIITEERGIELEIDIQKLYEKYLTLDIPNPFTLEQIHERLTQKYYGEKVDLERFSNLRRDPEAGFDKALAAYVFEDERGIRELVKLNRDEDIHEPLEFAWVINSTLIGISELLSLEIYVFHGMDKEEMVLGNLRFEEFLIVLYLTGYIQFENDSLIDQVIARYKEGYCFRFFGMQDGYENYLYKDWLKGFY